MALKVGDLVPHFQATSLDGGVFDSSKVLGIKPLVIYFYPKDDTPGCTAQACGFRDHYEEFKAVGAEVMGISSDSSTSHQKFANRYQLPFVLLSDKNKALRKLFGVQNDFFGIIPGRVTYVIDKEGRIQLIFNSMSGPIHVQKALSRLKEIEN